MAAATTTRRGSASCGSILNFRANNSVDQQQHHHQSRDDDVVRSHSHRHHQSIAAVNNSGGGGGGGSCTGKVDSVAMWIINGVASAFFASLHRCSCIRIATVDDGDDLNDEDDVPLIYNDANFNNNQRDGMSGFGQRRRRKATIIFQDNKDQKNKSDAQD